MVWLIFVFLKKLNKTFEFEMKKKIRNYISEIYSEIITKQFFGKKKSFFNWKKLTAIFWYTTTSSDIWKIATVTTDCQRINDKIQQKQKCNNHMVFFVKKKILNFRCASKQNFVVKWWWIFLLFCFIIIFLFNKMLVNKINSILSIFFKKKSNFF